MIFLNSFECYVIGVRSKYDKSTGSCLIADFGDRVLESLKHKYDARISVDEAVRSLKKESLKERCAFASQAF